MKALNKRVCELMGFDKWQLVSGQTYSRKIDYQVLTEATVLFLSLCSKMWSSSWSSPRKWGLVVTVFIQNVVARVVVTIYIEAVHVREAPYDIPNEPRVSQGGKSDV